MATGEKNIDDFGFVGGALCLDFCNTAGSRLAETPGEYLRSYPDVVAWSTRAGALTEGEEKALIAEATARSDEAAAMLERVLRIRAVLFRILSAQAQGERPPPDALGAFNKALPGALSRLRLAAGAERPTWTWEGREGALDRPLWPVLRSAAELLTEGPLGRLKMCDGADCGWLFIDESRNRSRRWCDMADCGNRAKARRYHRRRSDER